MPSLTQSIALWHAHKMVCPYCSNPIRSLADLEIDHVIPESLSKDADALRRLLNRLGVPGLDLNSYRNWLPVHGRPCNRNKGDRLLPDTTLLNYLDLAQQRERHAFDEECKIAKQARNKNALAPLVHLIEIGELSREEAISLIQSTACPSRKRSDPLVLSFSVNVFKLVDSGKLPDDVPEAPALYDWLEGQLEEALRSTEALFARADKVQSERNGESVSARYAFWLLDLDLLPYPLPYGWELLEVASFSEVFPSEDAEGLFAKGIIARRYDLILDMESTDPLPYKRCPECGSSTLRRASSTRGGEEIFYISCDCGWGERS